MAAARARFANHKSIPDTGGAEPNSKLPRRATHVSFTYGIPTTYDLPPMTKPPHPTSTCLVCYYSLLVTTTDYDLILRITMYGSAQVHTTIYCLPLTDTYCYLRLLTTMYLLLCTIAHHHIDSRPQCLLRFMAAYGYDLLLPSPTLNLASVCVCGEIMQC